MNQFSRVPVPLTVLASSLARSTLSGQRTMTNHALDVRNDGPLIDKSSFQICISHFSLVSDANCTARKCEDDSFDQKLNIAAAELMTSSLKMIWDGKSKHFVPFEI